MKKRDGEKDAFSVFTLSKLSLFFAAHPFVEPRSRDPQGYFPTSWVKITILSNAIALDEKQKKCNPTEERISLALCISFDVAA